MHYEEARAQLSALSDQVSPLGVQSLGHQHVLDQLVLWYNQVARRVFALERRLLRVDRLERDIARLQRANVLLLRALQESRDEHELLRERVAALEIAGL